ncbi:alpha/beta hydrolase [Sphingobium sp.]|uniref:alpha/beta fold hydrolase n=1 Tax=Sphingobium sp. TaxID=1912891 RepID=UPI002CA50186|nr:alpha/beta hydrolase [Sphingobium sp.]HUD95517.1 alpha/beta hydrolase [Sphingobium sp.]
MIDRAFARVAEGLIHYRHVEGNGTPLLLLHASPGSSANLAPLIEALTTTGKAPALIAPDTPGNGDSAALAAQSPDMADYADALVRLMDALGIDRANIYGAHTGARIAVEAGVRHPDRVAAVIADGIGEYEGALRDELIERYAPEVQPDDYGAHLLWAFHFVRDQALHFPHYARDPAHRLMTRAVPDADALHRAAMEVLKALGTYHHAYRAAFAYPTRARLERLERPFFLLDAIGEIPGLRAQAEALAKAAPDCRLVPVESGLSAKAEAIVATLS